VPPPQFGAAEFDHSIRHRRSTSRALFTSISLPCPMSHKIAICPSVTFRVIRYILTFRQQGRSTSDTRTLRTLALPQRKRRRTPFKQPAFADVACGRVEALVPKLTLDRMPRRVVEQGNCAHLRWLRSIVLMPCPRSRPSSKQCPDTRRAQFMESAFLPGRPSK
jgi:hypothetical protein